MSGSVNGQRLRNPAHAVEHLSGDDDFALLRWQTAGTQLRSDDRLVASDRGFRETAPAIACRLLPRHAAPLCDQADVAIALVLRLSALRARHRRCTRWDDDVGHWIWLVIDD